jgi:hypothetical protein
MMNMNQRFTITELAETESHKLTHNTARTDWRDDNPATERIEFVGVDGEGITLPDGTHRYVLLGIGDKQISNPLGLTFRECFQFLWDNKRRNSRPTAYVGFFLGYDFTQMFRTLREDRARMLLTKQGQDVRKPRKDSGRFQPFPVEYDGWQFDILGTKRLRIRPKSCNCENQACEHVNNQPWMTICDVGPFFQKSFLKVIDPKEWGTPVVSPETFAKISAGKSRRSSADLDDDMRSYNRLENASLSLVMAELAKGLSGLGIYLRPDQWFGPGQAAQAWLKGRVITKEFLTEITPPEVLEAAQASYYGGWFEIFVHGIIKGITYEYDINSAYPHIISGLPCLEHGEWLHGNGGLYFTDERYVLVSASVKGHDRYIGCMPHRDEYGNISRPLATEGWYWLHELRAAQRARLIHSYDIREWHHYLPGECPEECTHSLGEVRDIYAMRIRVGKKTPLGIACKLVPNSLYGKFAQSIGNPRYANAVYASLITSGCRTMILDAIATHPEKSRAVRMVATDGVYFSSPHPGLPQGSDLGAWEMEQKRNICLFKPGVYWDDKTRAAIASGDAPVFKARGVNAKDFASQLATVDEMFRNLYESKPQRVEWPKIEFPIGFSMITAVQALQRGKWELAGTLVPDPTAKQSSNPILKRESWYWDNDGNLRSRPPHNLDPYEPSHPYKKRFGVEDPYGQEHEEEIGITPDGFPSDLWKEALNESQ